MVRRRSSRLPAAYPPPGGPRLSAAPTLPPALGAPAALPDAPRGPGRRRRPARRRGQLHQQLHIPPVSHLPVSVVAQRAAAGLVAVMMALSAVSIGLITWDSWGSNVYAHVRQEALARSLAAAPPPAAPVVAPAPAASWRDMPDPALLVDAPPWQPADPVGQIRIDKIALDDTFVFGTGEYELTNGPGLWRWGVVPGQPGNAMISGHRTTYGAPFHDLHLLEPGDRITITIPGQTDAVFEVRDTLIVTPQDVWVSDQTPGVRLTLTACHPLWSARERIVVRAELVEGDHVGYAVPAGEWAEVS